MSGTGKIDRWVDEGKDKPVTRQEFRFLIEGVVQGTTMQMLKGISPWLVGSFVLSVIALLLGVVK